MPMLLQVGKWTTKQIWIGPIKRGRKLRFNGVGPAELKAATAQLRLLKVKVFFFPVWFKMTDGRKEWKKWNKQERTGCDTTRGEKELEENREKNGNVTHQRCLHHLSGHSKATTQQHFCFPLRCSHRLFLISPSEPNSGSRCFQTCATTSLQEICRTTL